MPEPSLEPEKLQPQMRYANACQSQELIHRAIEVLAVTVTALSSAVTTLQLMTGASERLGIVEFTDLSGPSPVPGDNGSDNGRRSDLPH